MKYIFLRLSQEGERWARRFVGSPGEGGWVITAQRFTALRTRVERRTPSGAGAASMASTSFLAFLAFFAAGFFAAGFLADFAACADQASRRRRGDGVSSRNRGVK